MFGLFFMLCMTGQPECYRFEGYVYPDAVNCHRDIEANHLSPSDFKCLPVDGVYSAEDADKVFQQFNK